MWLSLACLSSCFFSVTAFADLVGQPPIRVFKPALDVYPDHYSIAQGDDGVVHVGSRDSVLLFDGARWSQLPMPNGQLVRSLAKGPAGRMYVGGYDAFGYIEADEAGNRRFVDLTAQARELVEEPRFADIWDILVTPDIVFFKGVKDVFAYRPATGAMQAWHSKRRFGAIALLAGEPILQWRGEGLKRFTGNDWDLLPGSAGLDRLIYEFQSLPDGSLLGFDVDDGWVRYDGRTAREYAMPAGFPSPARVSVGTTLGDGSIAYATTDGWIYVFDPQREHFHRFEIGSARINGLVRASDGGLLALDDLALSHVGWPSDWSRIGASAGLAGGLYAAERWNGQWVVMTGAGAFTARDDDAELVFRRRNWTSHEAWDLLPLGGDEALLADSYQLLHLRGTGIAALSHSNLYPRVMLQGSSDPGVIYVGTELGLAILAQQDGRWELLFERDDFDNLRVTSMVELARGDLLVASERGGIRRVRFNEYLDAITKIERQDSTIGLEGVDGRTLVSRLPDGRVIASTRAGLFEFRRDRWEAAGIGGLAELRRDDEILCVAANGDFAWAWSELRVFRRSREGGWKEAAVNGLRQGVVEQVLPLEGGRAVAVSTNGLLSFNPRHDDVDFEPPRVRLRSVEVLEPDGGRRRLSLDREQPIELPQGDYGIVFSYSLADFSNPVKEIYRARLLGFEEQFSEPSATNRITYSRLAPGEYRFEVMAKDAEGRQSAIRPFSLVITPAWYNTPMLRGLGIVIIMLLIIAATMMFERSRTRRLENERSRLARMVAERTHELENANRKLETMAHLDGLTGIPNRRRLDEYLETVWNRGAERGRSLSVLVIDVDHFKEFNDRHGHLAGDQLLQRLAQILSRCLRRTEDLVARYGGEEFLAVLPGADRHAAMELAEQMRSEVEDSSVGATISIGLACLQPTPGHEFRELIQLADEALYAAKADGRNCVRARQGSGR